MCDLRVSRFIFLSNAVPLCFCPSELTRTYTQDGVCLTESGLSQLQSLANAASRRRRSKPKLKLKIINQNSVAVLQTPPDPQTELSRGRDLDNNKSTSYFSNILPFRVVIDRYWLFYNQYQLFVCLCPDNRYAEQIFIYCYKVHK